MVLYKMARLEIEENLNIPKVRITVRSDKSLSNQDTIKTVFGVYKLAEKYRGRSIECKSFPETREGKKNSSRILFDFFQSRLFETIL